MAGRKKREGPVNYFELPRKQLQSLCKKYGFPANKTNQLMAHFLTSHLNSDEYLNRDKSFPSPAVKTRFQILDEEGDTPSLQWSTENFDLHWQFLHGFAREAVNRPATDDNLPTISESQPAVAGTKVKNLSQEFMNVDATPTDPPVEASKAEGTGLGEAIQNGSEDMAGESNLLGAMDIPTSGFRIREYKHKSIQGTPLPSSTTEVFMDSEMEGSPRGSRAESGHFSSPEEGMDVTSGFESQVQETPLPLSIMPYVSAATPNIYALSDCGVKLFVDLKNDGLSPVENLRDYYRAWGAQLPLSSEKMQDDGNFEALTTSEGSERNPHEGFNRTDRAVEEGDMNFLCRQSVTSTSSKKTEVAPLKSCLLTSNRKPSPLSVSFLCPTPIFSSPGVINGMVSDASERSGIVKEWSVADQSTATIIRSDGFSCSAEEKAANGELLKNMDEKLLAKELCELSTRTPKSTAGLESPPEGIVEKVVQICEERTISTGPSSVRRKDSYKASPFLKSYRIAAELERASKLGQTRRVGILALKRAMGVAPLFSDTPDAEKEPRVAESSSNGTAESDPNTSGTHVPFPDSMAIQVEGFETTEISPNTMEIVTRNGSDANTSDIPVPFPDSMAIQVEEIAATEVSSNDMEIVTNGTAGSDASDSGAPVPFPDSTLIQVEGIEATEVSPNDMEIVTQTPSTEHLVAVDAFQTETTTQLAQDTTEQDEQTVFEMDTTGHKADESSLPVAEDAVSLPATVEESVTNLSWMTKPIQLPTRRPVSHKLKEKPGRPFSANGRSFELMERASVKLKMLKKSAAGRGEAVSSRLKTSTTTSAAAEGLDIRGCSEQLEPAVEVPMTVEAAEEHPIGSEGKAADDSSPKEMSSELDIAGDWSRITSLESAAYNSSPEETSSQSDTLGDCSGIASLDEAPDNSSPEETSSQLMITDNDCGHQKEEEILSVVEDDTFKGSFCDASIHNDKVSISTEEELNVHQRSYTVDSVPTERPNLCEALKSEEKALSFLDIDFTKIKVENAVEVPPGNVLEVGAKNVRERIAAGKPIPLSPLDSNRQAIDAVVDSLPNPTTPTKPSGILDALGDNEEKNNANGLSLYGKENEWSKRQEQHKTPLTGRSKEKALRTAEKKSSNLREQLLRKRRGMMEQLIDAEDSPVESVQPSPLKQLTTNRLL